MPTTTLACQALPTSATAYGVGVAAARTEPLQPYVQHETRQNYYGHAIVKLHFSNDIAFILARVAYTHCRNLSSGPCHAHKRISSGLCRAATPFKRGRTTRWWVYRNLVKSFTVPHQPLFNSEHLRATNYGNRFRHSSRLCRQTQAFNRPGNTLHWNLVTPRVAKSEFILLGAPVVKGRA